MIRSLALLVVVTACAKTPPSAAPAEHRVEPVTTPAPIDEATETNVTRDEDAGAPSDSTGPCTGQAPDGFIRAIQARAVETRRCYERALKTTPTLSGRMVVMLWIAEDGTVKAQLGQGEIDDSGMRDCVVSTFERAITPQPQGGCVNVSIPLLFQPKTDAGTP